MAHSHSKGGPASFRPSEPTRKTQRHVWNDGIAHSNKRHEVFTPPHNFEGKKDSHRPAQSTKTCHASSLLFLSLTTSHSLSQRFHGERKAFVAVTVPHENFTGTVTAVKRGEAQRL